MTPLIYEYLYDERIGSVLTEDEYDEYEDQPEFGPNEIKIGDYTITTDFETVHNPLVDGESNTRVHHTIFNKYSDSDGILQLIYHPNYKVGKAVYKGWLAHMDDLADISNIISSIASEVSKELYDKTMSDISSDKYKCLQYYNSGFDSDTKNQLIFLLLMLNNIMGVDQN